MIHRPLHRSRHAAALRRACAIALLAPLAFGLVAAGQERTPPAPTPFDAAMEAYEHCHWDEAFQAFATLADQGHSEAARVALLMLRHGQSLYRRDFAAKAERRLAWLAAAAIADARTAARATP
jgi:hypothetical protein